MQALRNIPLTFFALGLALTTTTGALGADRAWGVEGDSQAQRDQLLPGSQPHKQALGQEDGERKVAAFDWPPKQPMSNTLLATEASKSKHVVKPKTEPAILEHKLKFKMPDRYSPLNIDFVELILEFRNISNARRINDIAFINSNTSLNLLPLLDYGFPNLRYSRASGYEFASQLIQQHHEPAKNRFSIEYYRNDRTQRVEFIAKDISKVTCITAIELKQKMPWLVLNMYRGVGVMHGTPLDFDDRYVFAVENSMEPYQITFWVKFNHQVGGGPLVTCLESFGVNEAESRPNYFISHFNF